MFIDIAFNVTEDAFKGSVDAVYKRAVDAGVHPVFVGLDAQSSLAALELSKKHGTGCYLGIHPLSKKKDGLDTLVAHFSEDNVIGIGECGLDYCRSSDREAQMQLFAEHLELGARANLPYFFHCREAYRDFTAMVGRYTHCGITGVVHSFDGTAEEAEELTKMGFYIGINGCSMRARESIEVIRSIPLTRLLIETDSPYCLIRKSYEAAKYVKGIIRARNNEPCYVGQVAEAAAAIKGIAVAELQHHAYENTLRLFPRLSKFIPGN